MRGSRSAFHQLVRRRPLLSATPAGGLVLPLSHNGWLLGLLVVERGSPALDPAASPLLQPLTCTLLGPREFQVGRRSMV